MEPLPLDSFDHGNFLSLAWGMVHGGNWLHKRMDYKYAPNCLVQSSRDCSALGFFMKWVSKMMEGGIALPGGFLVRAFSLYKWRDPLYPWPPHGGRIDHDMAAKTARGVADIVSAGGREDEKARFQLSAEKFPDFRSCLLDHENMQQNPDVRLVDRLA